MTRERPKPSKSNYSASDTFTPTQLNQGRSPTTTASSNIASRQSTESFVRRTLCSHKLHSASSGAERTTATPIEQLLPPLTSSNDLDLELYAFIAILIKEYVQPWYGKITSDPNFVDEVLQVIAHCTRALEQRFRSVDWEVLALEDAADLLNAHVTVYRFAQEAVQDPGLQVSIRKAYHTLRPHPALSPVPDADHPKSIEEQASNDTAYRNLLAQGLLATLLPTEDLQNPPLRALVSEVAADLVLGQFMSQRFCEPSFIYESIARACSSIQQRAGRKDWVSDQETVRQSKLGSLGLLDGGNDDNNQWRDQRKRLTRSLWRLYDFLVLIISLTRAFLAAFAVSLVLPQRDSGTPVSPLKPTAETPTGSKRGRKAVVDYRIWTTAENAVQLSLRMPWLFGTLSFVHHYLTNGPGTWGAFNGRLDRLLAHHIVNPLLSPAHLPLALQNLRAALFPGNAVPKPSQAPLAPGAAAASSLSSTSNTRYQDQPTQQATAEAHQEPQTQTQTQDTQAAASRHAAALAILNLIPAPLARIYFGTAAPSSPSSVSSIGSVGSSSTSSRSGGDVESTTTTTATTQAAAAAAAHATREIEDVLAVFGDAYLNRHLLYGVVELVVARAVPELGARRVGGEGKGVGELLAERGVG